MNDARWIGTLIIYQVKHYGRRMVENFNAGVRENIAYLSTYKLDIPRDW